MYVLYGKCAYELKLLGRPWLPGFLPAVSFLLSRGLISGRHCSPRLPCRSS